MRLEQLFIRKLQNLLSWNLCRHFVAQIYLGNGHELQIKRPESMPSLFS